MICFSSLRDKKGVEGSAKQDHQARTEQQATSAKHHSGTAQSLVVATQTSRHKKHKLLQLQ